MTSDQGPDPDLHPDEPGAEAGTPNEANPDATPNEANPDATPNEVSPDDAGPAETDAPRDSMQQGPTEVMPMFPLGSVLFPSMMLPLHVFEERYRALAADVTSEFSSGEFGVALIERGSEVGGGDVRSMIATVAKVIEFEEFGDGRWGMVCVGTRRVRVAAWLPDDPYPVALVEPVEDGPPTDQTEALLQRVTEKFLSCWNLASQLGDPLGDPPELSDEPSLASLQIAGLAPISSFDQYDMLAATDPDVRLTLLDGALDGAAEVLQFHLDGPSEQG